MTNPATEKSIRAGFTLAKQRDPERIRGFTLFELIIVIGIIALLLVLMAPAFTTIKGGSDVTSAAYTIKGVLETARTYAKANNTYTWVGFGGSVGPTVTGEVAMAVVASKDGTNVWSINNGLVAAAVAQVGKKENLENVHIGNVGAPSGDGTDFGNRPSVDSEHSIYSAPAYSFDVQQVPLTKWIQFSPRGEAAVPNATTPIAQYSEVPLIPTHGTALGSNANVVAIQVSGLGGAVKVYRR
jgi:prepilin-type N-terminal cleavage/methylation domain-containing protein